MVSRLVSLAESRFRELYQRGAELKATGQFEAAIQVCEQLLSEFSLECQEESIIFAHLGNLLSQMGMLDDALAAYAAGLARDPGCLALHADRLLCLNNLPLSRMSREELFRLHQERGLALEAQVQAKRVVTPRARREGQKVRVGYVSGDFRKHAVSFFLEGALARHDRIQFEVYLYSTQALEDDWTLRFRHIADHWRDLAPLSDEHAALAIRQDQIDILVDLSGMTGGNRLGVFAQKPAPIQVSWLGYPNTSGLSTIDYRITDSDHCPAGADAYYTEKLVRLTRFSVFVPPSYAQVPVTPLPAFSGHPFTFGSFNHPRKLNSDVLLLWGQILSALPRSRLLIVYGADASNRNAYFRRLVRHGISARQIELLGQVTDEGYYSLLSSCDITLDPFPYCGTTTSANSLWMGVPVITLQGDSERERTTSSLLKWAGLEGFTARTTDEYFASAVRWSQDLEGLSRIRAGLRSRTSADPAQMVRELEARFMEWVTRQGK